MSSYVEKVISEKHVADVVDEMNSAKKWLNDFLGKKVTAIELLRHWLGNEAEEEIEDNGVGGATDRLLKDLREMYYNAKGELVAIKMLKDGSLELPEDPMAFITLHEISVKIGKSLREKKNSSSGEME